MLRKHRCPVKIRQGIANRRTSTQHRRRRRIQNRQSFRSLRCRHITKAVCPTRSLCSRRMDRWPHFMIRRRSHSFRSMSCSICRSRNRSICGDILNHCKFHSMFQPMVIKEPRFVRRSQRSQGRPTLPNHSKCKRQREECLLYLVVLSSNAPRRTSCLPSSMIILGSMCKGLQRIS